MTFHDLKQLASIITVSIFLWIGFIALWSLISDAWRGRDIGDNTEPDEEEIEDS